MVRKNTLRNKKQSRKNTQKRQQKKNSKRNLKGGNQYPKHIMFGNLDDGHLGRQGFLLTGILDTVVKVEEVKEIVEEITVVKTERKSTRN